MLWIVLFLVAAVAAALITRAAPGSAPYGARAFPQGGKIMIEFLAANWLWIVVVVAFFAMHRSGMGCGVGHGGHGSHGGHTESGDEAAAGRSSAERPEHGAGHGGHHGHTTQPDRAPTEGASGAR